ncbi:hypothetical protein ABT354_17745 [Streptomyces sp. NPDC000594]|uniref:hypothetical protein n=1 Tax=Streptomyces sp. NPDC000594 TaxID=3154261 RepID=UPI00331C4A2B
MTSSTALSWIVLSGLALLLLSPSLAGHLRDRRIDRQLGEAERRPHDPVPGPGTRAARWDPGVQECPAAPVRLPART